MSDVANEGWALIQWGNDTRGVVSYKNLVDVDHKVLQFGNDVVVHLNNEDQLATFLAKSDDRSLLEQILKKTEELTQEDAGPSKAKEEDRSDADYYDGSSSWVPSAEESDSSEWEDEEVKGKKPKRQKTSETKQTINENNSRKVLTPSNRVNPIIPQSVEKSSTVIKYNNRTWHEKHEEADKENRFQKPEVINIQVNIEDIIKMKNMFKDVFKMIGDMRRFNNDSYIDNQIEEPKGEDEVLTSEEPGSEIYNGSHNEKLNRSEGNGLISKRHDNILENVQKQVKEDVNYNNESNNTQDETNYTHNDTSYTHNESNYSDNESNYTQNASQNMSKKTDWVPIGSGLTLIHKDKFRKIKWTSYTVATRGLMLAVFPRRVLATHSLTGKKSPAFQNKPAKLCLDPKKVSDIIIEIMDRFKVKENLIRSIITTKCADECKMWRMRAERNKSVPTQNENMPPPSAKN